MLMQVRREKIELLLKESFRPVNKLITEIQICLVFWVLGRRFSRYCGQNHTKPNRVYLELAVVQRSRFTRTDAKSQ